MARPAVLCGNTHRVKTSCGKLYVTVNSEKEQPLEVFASMGHTGGCIKAQSEAITRLITAYLKIGGSLKYTVSQLEGIRCPEPKGEVLSCPDGIAKVLRTYLGEPIETRQSDPDTQKSDNTAAQYKIGTDDRD